MIKTYRPTGKQQKQEIDLHFTKKDWTYNAHRYNKIQMVTQ